MLEDRALKFITCGSVDDGKSTLLGRLLVDAELVLDDQFAAIGKSVGGRPDLSYLTDGLLAEREQGITIDVAYRYFRTPRRAFIAADAPGHEQYTRNMATAASTADLAIILVDARKGVVTQTRRHSVICHLLGIRHVVLAINKADLIDFDEASIAAIDVDYRRFAEQLSFAEVVTIPMSALDGDFVAEPSGRMPWYRGPTLLGYLESVDLPATTQTADLPFRMAVQSVTRPHQDFRGVSGRIVSGRLCPDDDIVIAASGRLGQIARIVTFDGDLAEAESGRSVTVVFSQDIDAARGDLLCAADRRATVANQFAATVIWMSEDQLYVGRSYWLRIGTHTVPAQITRVQYRLDISTFEHQGARTLVLNEIGGCEISTMAPVAFDPYSENHDTGSFILIDRATKATLAAGMITFALRRASNIHKHATTLDRSARAALKHQAPLVVWFTGLSGSGKSTIANLVEKELADRGLHTALLDGDNVRHGLNKDLGFTTADRIENIRRVGEVANLMLDAGLVVLCSFISPFASERRLVRELVGEAAFVEVFIDAPIDTCISRDPKGLYAKALAGRIPNFTGIASPYERPERADLTIDTSTELATSAAARIVDLILGRQS